MLSIKIFSNKKAKKNHTHFFAYFLLLTESKFNPKFESKKSKKKMHVHYSPRFTEK